MDSLKDYLVEWLDSAEIENIAGGVAFHKWLRNKQRRVDSDRAIKLKEERKDVIRNSSVDTTNA
jgi:hypothetical protein